MILLPLIQVTLLFSSSYVLILCASIAIYGRRGVGKTDIALEYAYANVAGFEAIFWIQCETSITLRQSFTDMACALNLPGADRNGNSKIT
jgi:hypothetical protein